MLAFSGFISATPATKGKLDSNTYATSYPVTIPDTAGVYGVAVAGMGLGYATTSWTGWTGELAMATGVNTGSVAYGEFIPGGGALDATATWTPVAPFSEPGYIWAVFPLTAPTPPLTVSYALGANAVTLALGANEVFGQLG